MELIVFLIFILSALTFYLLDILQEKFTIKIKKVLKDIRLIKKRQNIIFDYIDDIYKDLEKKEGV